MIFYPSNYLAFPLLILLSALDAYLLAATTRIVLGQISSARANRLCLALAEIVDPPVHHVERWLVRWWNRPSPGWVPWAIFVSALLLARGVFSSVIVAVLK